jgi:hypothetical protein
MRPRRHALRAAPAAVLLAVLVAAPARHLGGVPAGVWAGAASAASPSAAPPSPVASTRLIVRTGDRAPDGGTFTELTDPWLNDRGDLAFGAETTAREAAQGLYLRRGSGPLRLLAAAGRAVSSGGTLQTLSDVVLNNRGTVVFLGRTTDRIAKLGIFAARGGDVVPIVVTGQAAPTGGVFTDFANPAINDRDVIAFVGRTNGTGGEGIFTNVEGTTAPAVMGGWPSPDGGVFQFFLDGSPALNSRGQMAFIASTTRRATQGVYVLTDGRVVPVVTTDDTAPVGGFFTEFGFINLTDAGTVGFVGRTARSSVHEAFYTTGRETLVTIVRQGDTVGGAAIPTVTNAVMNAGEDVVFEPGIVRFPDVYPHTIYLGRRSGLAVIAQAGRAAPGGGRFTAFSQPIINDRRTVAFVAETDDGRHGIYLLTLR